MMTEEGEIISNSEAVANGSWDFSHLWEYFLNQVVLPIALTCIGIAYSFYAHFSPVHVLILFLKYVPTGVYMYKFTKNIYITSRERIKQKQSELEDIQLQIQIVNTKLSVRDCEFVERAEQLQHGVEQLRRVRLKVRDLIAADETLRHMLDGATLFGTDHNSQAYATPEQDHDFIVQLLKELKYEPAGIPIPEKYHEKTVSGDHATEPNTPENSIYSSLSDGELKQDYQVKIVKVTNVYKVAYLKHYIKQKRLRRANKQAVLKKKMESIKKLLEDWQKSLNMVINNKLTILNMEPHVDLTSQEAMGDYSKPTLRESSDSDSDLRNSTPDMWYDEYSRGWAQNPYRSYPYDYDDVPETAVSREHYDSQEYNEMKYTCHQIQQCESNNLSGKLSTLLEETKSQVAIEEVKGEGDEDSQDLNAFVL